MRGSLTPIQVRLHNMSMQLKRIPFALLLASKGAYSDSLPSPALDETHPCRGSSHASPGVSCSKSARNMSQVHRFVPAKQEQMCIYKYMYIYIYICVNVFLHKHIYIYIVKSLHRVPAPHKPRPSDLARFEIRSQSPAELQPGAACSGSLRLTGVRYS